MNLKVKAAVFALATSSYVMAAGVVNLYTHRHYDTDKILYEDFQKQTGIKVNVVKGKANELIARLQSEGENSPADVFITADAGNLYQAKSKGLLQSIDSKYLKEAIPAHLRDKDNQWFALTKRARVIVYAKDRIKPEMLSTYENLADAKWKGKIMVRSSSNVYNQSLLASIIANDGKEKAETWAKGVVSNMAKAPKGNDRYQVKSIANGIGDVAIVNTYYIGKMITGKDKEEQEAAKKVAIFFPNQNDRGTHINISGAGVTKSSKNKENAIKFLEFLLSKEAQQVFAEANSEFPILKGVAKSKVVESWGDFKEDSLPINALGENNSEAVVIFDKVGWK